MAAAALARTLESRVSIRLIESEDIGTVGVGEATVPHLRAFNDTLRIDEVEFVRAVRGTFKLGIQFVDWGSIGSRYIHGFGTIGHDYRGLPFHQYWLKLQRSGQGAGPRRVLAEHRGRAARQVHDRRQRRAGGIRRCRASPMPITSTPGCMRSTCAATPKRAASQRIEGEIVDVTLRAADGFIESVTLKSGERVAATCSSTARVSAAC